MLKRSLRSSLLSFTFTALAALGLGQSASAITITADGSGQALPGDCTFACTLRYQQIYASEIFSEPVTIERIDFLASNGDFWGRDARYEARFSVVANGVNNLTGDLDANVGSNEARFELRRFTGSVLPDDFFGFAGSYDYDPQQGDLLVDIVRVGGLSGGPEVYYNTASNTGNEYSRAYSFTSLSTGNAGPLYGNVTRFTVTPLPVESAPTVPLPASLPLLALGLASLHVLHRRKAKHQTV